MAKVSLNKLNLKKEESKKISILKINDDINIEIKQYLPISEKLELIIEVLSNSIDGINYFANPIRVEMYASLGIIRHYSNLSFTEKQMEEADKTFDLLETNGIIDAIINAIPEDEYQFLLEGIEDTIESYYKYKTSLMGLMESVTQEYNNLDLDATKIQEKLNSSEGVEFLKEVLTKLG